MVCTRGRGARDGEVRACVCVRLARRADEPVDEASRPVSAGDVDLHDAVADNEAASAEGTAPAAAPTPGGAEQDDDEFPAPSPYPSPPATGSRPGTASSTSSRGVSKAPRDVLVRRQH